MPNLCSSAYVIEGDAKEIKSTCLDVVFISHLYIINLIKYLKFIRKRPHIIAQSMTKMQGQLLLVENVISSLQISGYNLIKNYDCKPK